MSGAPLPLQFDTIIKFIRPLLFEVWSFVYKTISSFSRSVILSNHILIFFIPIIDLNMTGCIKSELFFFGGGGKCLKICQKLHGGDRKHTKVCQKTKISNQQMGYFSPLYQLQSSISRNRHVRLVPCFVGVQHMFISVQVYIELMCWTAGSKYCTMWKNA